MSDKRKIRMSDRYNRELHGLADTLGLDHADLKEFIRENYDVDYHQVDNQLAKQISYDLHRVMADSGIDWVPEKLQKLRVTMEELIAITQVVDAALAKDYHMVAVLLKILERKYQTWKYLHRFKNGIARIEEHFNEAFRRPTWPGNMKGRILKSHRNKVGFYISICGVARLIGDITQAKKDFEKPQSLLYFVTAREHASRWDNLVIAKLEEEWQGVKDAEKEATEELDLGLGQRTDDPEWVVDARQRLQEILQGRQLIPREHAREVRRLLFMLRTHGYEIGIPILEKENSK